MKIFVTGIGTEVGKTIVSAVLCEALQADYWKPVQAGNLERTDTDIVKSLVSNSKSVFHPETYRLKLPASPHKAAKAERKTIRLEHFKIPKTGNHLIVEGAGGLLVPLNQKDLMIDLVSYLNLPVILVSRNYLGSINHTLLSLEALKIRKIQLLGIVFNGYEDNQSENIVLKIGRSKLLGRIDHHAKFNQDLIADYSRKIKPALSDY